MTPESSLNIKFFSGPLKRGLRFKKALPVQVRKQGETYVVDCQLIGQFGYGSNIAEAVDDFGKTVSEMYFSLFEESEAGRLSGSPAATFTLLRDFIEPHLHTSHP